MRLAIIENLKLAEGYVHQKGIFPAREAIVNALTAYKACFDAEPGGSVWAGLNLLAVSAFAKRKGISTFA